MPMKAKPVPVTEPQLVISSAPLAVTIQQAAKLIGVSDKTLYAFSRRPGFPKVTFGSKSVVPIDALRRWLEENIGTTLTTEKEE